MARAQRFFIGYNSERRGLNITLVISGLTVDPFDHCANRVLSRLESGWL